MQKIQNERTLVVIKPDGVQRSLIGEIVKRLERSGLKLIGLKFIVPSAEFIEEHYTLDKNWLRNVGIKSIEGLKEKGITPKTEDPEEAGRKVLDTLKKYMISGPVVVMAWQGANAVKIVRKIVGSTEPLSSDVGTIRGDFVLDSYNFADADGRSVRNLVHASGSVDEADMEINHWFKDGELVNYRLVQEQILYDVNLDGILE
jgi:nucleoside-diphosphate kinase